MRMSETGNADTIIRLRDVHLTLPSMAGEVHILRGLNLEVAQGETLGVVGPSGSGKTSMLMVLAGLERSTRGVVQVAGTDLVGQSEDELALFRRENVGIVFQAFHLLPTMTAMENVAVPLEFAHRADAFTEAGACLERVGLGHRLTHYPSQLSGGEQQRVALARAFVTRPHLLLADEPTGNLDGDTGQLVIDLMFELSEQNGTTLLLITHDLTVVQRCERVVRLVDGTILEA